MSTLVTLVGNPKSDSRTLSAAGTLADALAERVDVTHRTVIDLADIAEGLLAPWRLSEAAGQAASDVRTADLLVIATPTYKASFTGLLKLFLDVLPAGSLASTVVVPLTVAGGPAHRHLADLQLRPVLSELGAVIPAPTLLLEESELPDLDDVVRNYVDRHGPVIAAAVGALAGSRQPA
ncbi:MAG TPA: NAD(P)H-dependent oxidoreductase [Nakamurella sp.]|jgi:FMN reductase